MDTMSPVQFSADARVDEVQAAAFLTERYGQDLQAVTPVGHGDWSRAYAFRHAGRDFVIRFGAHAEDFAKDRLAARYASPDLPVPRVIEIGPAYGSFYAVSERAFGGYLDALDAAELRALLPALFAALDAARRVQPLGRGYGLWDANGIAPHANWRDVLLDVGRDRPRQRTHGWRRQLAMRPAWERTFDTLCARLEALVSFCPNERHLVHSDLLHNNVLVEGGHLSAVLDWGSSLYGDFLYDVAWLVFCSPWYPAWESIDFADAAARYYAACGIGLPHYAQRLRCYQLHIGLGSLAYNAFRERWAVFEATARRTLALFEAPV